MTESAMDAEVFGAPAWVWAQLCAAVFAISTAGVAFQQLTNIPPLLLASWRMQATALLLAVGAVREWRVASDDLRARWFKTWPRLGFSGACLGAHFGAWVADRGLRSTPWTVFVISLEDTPSGEMDASSLSQSNPLAVKNAVSESTTSPGAKSLSANRPSPPRTDSRISTSLIIQPV